MKKKLTAKAKSGTGPKLKMTSMKSMKSQAKPAAKKAVKTVKAVKSAKSLTPKGISPLRLLNDKKKEQLQKMHASGKHTGKQLAEKFDVSISTLYNYLHR